MAPDQNDPKKAPALTVIQSSIWRLRFDQHFVSATVKLRLASSELEIQLSDDVQAERPRSRASSCERTAIKASLRALAGVARAAAWTRKTTSSSGGA